METQTADPSAQKQKDHRTAIGWIAIVLSAVLCIVSIVSIVPGYQVLRLRYENSGIRPESLELVVPHGPIGLNTADKATLMTLPGIGDKLADAILAEREKGWFRIPEQLLAVKGIGKKRMEAIRPLVNVDLPEETDAQQEEHSGN